MYVADMMERFVVKAGLADADESRKLVMDYKGSPEFKALGFGEWAVMQNRLTPDQVRTVIDFYEASRYQCLECGDNVYGRDLTDPIMMVCPFCGARDFTLRGTAMGARKSRARKAPGAPGSGGGDVTSLIESSEGVETQAISRAPKLPVTGDANAVTKVIESGETSTPEAEPASTVGQRKQRSVPLELLQVMKGQPLDEFLRHLPNYRLREWNAALVLIAYMKRHDLAPVALADAKKRFADLAQLSMVTRTLPGPTVALQDFVYELVRQTAGTVATLGAFLAHREELLETVVRTLSTVMPGAQLEHACGRYRELAAAEVSELLAFFLKGSSVRETLTDLQAQWLPENANLVEAMQGFLQHPEPFVRAMVAHVASWPDSALETDVLDRALGEESHPFVAATLQAALDRRGGIETESLSVFDKVLILKQTSLFAGLDRESIISVANVADEADTAEGEVIFEQDTPGDSAYILVNGRVEVLRTDAEGNERKLAELAAPHFFGEMAILS